MDMSNFPLPTATDSYTIVWSDGATWSSYTKAHAEYILAHASRTGTLRAN